MQLYQQYVLLKQSLSREDRRTDANSSDWPVTIEEIAGWLYCTERNVKHILRRMTEFGWISWKPGRGRGNRSQIRFIASEEDLLLQEAKSYAEQGNLKSAMAVFQLEGLDPWLSEKFLAWLGGFFGYQHAEEDGEDTLRLPTRSRIYTLDPARLHYARDLHYAKMALDTLVRFDPDQDRIVPLLAHSWDRDEQALTWTFYLRKGVKFHHGREMTASDVVYSMQRLKESPSSITNGWLTETIAGIKAIGRRIVEFELSSPNFMLLHLLSSSPMSIVPEDVYRNAESNGTDIGKFPVGTGPFRIVRHDEGVLSLEAFPDYWSERAHLDRIELLFIPKELENSESSSGLRFHLGSEDFVKNACFDYSKWRQMRIMTLGCSLMAINLRKSGPLRDSRMREAIGAVLNRAGFAESIGAGIPAYDFLPPQIGEPPITPYEDNRSDYARSLVESSGYQGEPLKLFTKESFRDQIDWLQCRFEEIGVKLDIHYKSHEEIADSNRILEADLMVAGVVGDDDEDRCLLEMYKMNNLLIRTYMSDDKRAVVDAEVASLLAEPSEEKRKNGIRGLQRLLTEDLQIHFLLHRPQNTLFSPKLRGLSINSLGYVDYKSVWFRSSSGT